MKNKSIFSFVLLFTFICTINLSCSKKDEELSRDVTITDSGFSSQVFTIFRTQTVVWGNLGSTAHTVTSDTGTELNSPNIAPGKTYPHTFMTKGTFHYHCANHPSMTGTIIVKD